MAIRVLTFEKEKVQEAMRDECEKDGCLDLVIGDCEQTSQWCNQVVMEEDHD